MKFIGKKDALSTTDHVVVGEKSDNSLKKIETFIFVQFLGSQNCLPDKKMALKKALPYRNLGLKYHYRTGIRLANILTEQEFGSQKFITGRELGSPIR